MKLFRPFLTGALAAIVTLSGVAVAAPASAQQRVVVRERTTVQTRHNGYHRPQARKATVRRVCKTRIRDHRRVRTCRTVRVRR